jgi:FkbM family methyltransferase
MDRVSLGGLVEKKYINTFFGPMVILNTDSRIGSELTSTGSWDFIEIYECMQLFEKNRNGNNVILDIGCNVGAWTLPVSRRYPEFIIHGFECQHPLIDCFDLTVKLNNLTNIESHLIAISNVNGTLEFPSIDYTQDTNFGAFELEPVGNSDFNGNRLNHTTVIETKTIDSFKFDNIALIKLDIEGMELKALQGAVNTLQKCQPIVLYEHHKTDQNAVIQLFKDINYKTDHSIGQLTCAVPNY